MSNDYLPARDADLATWAAQASDAIDAAPATWGIAAPTATDLLAKSQAFTAALNAATNGATRGKATILAKDEAKRILIDAIRPVIRTVQAFSGTTDAMRSSINITIPKTHRTPASVINVWPTTEVLGVMGRNVRIRLKNGTEESNALPDFASEALVWTFVGATPPANPAAWTFVGPTRRMTTSFDVAGTEAATVWISCQWRNARGMGPANPVAACATVAATVSSPQVSMRLAA